MSFEIPSSFADKVREKVANGIEGNLELDQKLGIANFAQELLEKLNIKTEFKSQDDEGFEEGRLRLNLEPGLIISNHPSTIDAPLILQLIKRSDLKIVVKELFYEKSATSPLFQDKLIPARKDPKGALETVNTISDHITQGGVVLIFPTGGREIDVHKHNFYSGFRHIVSKIDPQNMVYTFNINLEDSKHLLVKDHLHLNTTATVLSGRPIPFSRFDKPSEVSVSEKYTNAGEWQSLISEKMPNRDKNRVLSDHYRQLFEESVS